MGGRTKRAIRSECDRFETDAEVLVLDGLVRAAVLGGSVAVGAGSTYLTRQGVYGRVDGVKDKRLQVNTCTTTLHAIGMHTGTAT